MGFGLERVFREVTGALVCLARSLHWGPDPGVAGLGRGPGETGVEYLGDAALARPVCSFTEFVCLGWSWGCWQEMGDGHAVLVVLPQWGRPQMITEPCSVSGRGQG